MRHRSPRPVADRLSSPVFLRRTALAVSAVAALGTASAVAMTTTDETPADRPATAAQAPTRHVTPTSVDAERAVQPSRSADRSATPKPARRHRQSTAPTTDPAPTAPAQAAPPASTARSAVPAPTTHPKPSTDPGPSPSDDSPPDTTAQTVSLVGGVWTVAMGASEPVASFDCSVDGGAWHTCSPTDTVTFTEAGKHALAVRATDNAGNTDPSPATVTVKVTGLGLG